MWSEVVIVVNVVLESAKTFANFILHTRLPCTVCCTVPFLEMQWNRGQTNSSSEIAPRMKRAQQANLSPQRAAAAQDLKIIFIPSLFFIDRVTHQPEWHYPNCESGGLTLLLIATKQNKQWKPLRKLLWSQWLHKHTELTHYFWQNLHTNLSQNKLIKVIDQEVNFTETSQFYADTPLLRKRGKLLLWYCLVVQLENSASPSPPSLLLQCQGQRGHKSPPPPVFGLGGGDSTSCHFI